MSDPATAQIILVSAWQGDLVPGGVEITHLDPPPPFLARPDVAAFLSEVGYGPERPDELVYAVHAGDYDVPAAFESRTFSVPAAEAQAVREARAGAPLVMDQQPLPVDTAADDPYRRR